MTRIATAMIVGPGESLRYLDRTLRLAREWADEIVVYGDGIDADTRDAVGTYATHVHFNPQNGFTTNESTVRNGLLEVLDGALNEGDIVVVLDADEELRPLAGGTPRATLKGLASDHGADAWAILWWQLWAPDGSVIRVDGSWRPGPDYRIYRHRPGGRVPDRAMACLRLPEGLVLSPAEPLLAIAHWGYARHHDRLLKHARYMHLDGGRYHSLAHLKSIVQEPMLEPVPRSCTKSRGDRPVKVDFVLVTFQDRGASQRISGQLERTVTCPYTLEVVSNTRRNIGWSAACNRGARSGGGELIAFLNQDLELQPGWCEPVMDAFRADPQLVISGPRCLDGLPWPRRPFGLDEWVCGACMVVRREFFEKVGGFDYERFPHEYADTDLQRTAVALGYRVKTIELAQVVHHYTPEASPQVLRWRATGARNEAQKWGVPIDPWGVADERQTVCLCMIVRDETAVIERCITSALPLIDRWVIVDTGSTDDTPQTLTRALEGVPGELHHRPWVSFGHNRSELMELAYGKADYLLLLDADWTLEGTIPPGLAADSYLIKHVGEPEFYNVRLVSGRKRWRFEGAVHEYITSDQPGSRAKLDTLVIHNHVDGGSRVGRHERDIPVLAGEINSRALFYLAQTYRELGRVQEAVALYRARAMLGGFEEEVYCSLLQAGVLSDDLQLLIRAREARPHRWEASYELATRLNRAGKHRLAAHFAQTGLNAPDPNGDVLFIARWMRDWGLPVELAHALWFSGERARAADIWQALLNRDDLPEHVASAVANNHAAFSPASLVRRRDHQLESRSYPPTAREGRGGRSGQSGQSGPLSR